MCTRNVKNIFDKFIKFKCIMEKQNNSTESFIKFAVRGCQMKFMTMKFFVHTIALNELNIPQNSLSCYSNLLLVFPNW